jgi:uncharacterized protein (TIGR03086 family)
MSSTVPPLPTFLIIGAQKSATRWLRSNLNEHPDVFAPELEPSYFNQKYRLGPDFYRSQFDGWNGEPIVGEATPGYMMIRHRPARVARRIHETVPDVRLIALLRNPIDRANSALVHHVKRERLSKRAKLTTVISEKEPEEDRLGLITGGWYAASLQPFIRWFGDQLLVFLHEDVSDDPRWVYRTALEHIGASPDFVPPALEEVVFSNQTRPSVRRRSSMSDEDRQKLWPYFADDVALLEPLIGRDLSSWNPNLPDDLWPAVPADLSAYALDVAAWMRTLVADLGPDDLDRPTPCADWNVGELVAHVVGSLVFTARLCGSATEGAPATTDEILSDPLRSFDDASSELQRVIDDRTLMKKAVIQVQIDAGVGAAMPTTIWVMSQLVNELVHGWDLAAACEKPAEVPVALAEPSLSFAHRLLELVPDLRAAYQGSVPVDAAASASDRLVAFFGRDPSLARPVEVH